MNICSYNIIYAKGFVNKIFKKHSRCQLKIIKNLHFGVKIIFPNVEFNAYPLSNTHFAIMGGYNFFNYNKPHNMV